jgi:group II intron reverse transcriptase/maturase
MIAKGLNTYKSKLQVFQEKLTLAAKRDRGRKFGILYDKVSWMETLEEAWRRVKANKGACGVDGESIYYIENKYGVEKFLKEIQEELNNKTYRPEKVRRVWIEKEGKQEKRPLGIPTVKDRVIQQAVKLIIEPILETDFQECSYGFRPGRNGQQAIDEVSKYLACGCQWVIDLDIKAYFDSIPHERLIMILRQRITDKWIIRLVRWWLKAGIMDGREIYYTIVGTPQGGVLSPLLANLYLNELDKEWNKRGYANRYKEDSHLIRYADDLVVLCPKEGTAINLYKEIEAILMNLELRLNQEKSRIVHLKEGFDFLGFHFAKGYSRRKKREVVIKFPSSKATKKIKEKIKAVLMRHCLGSKLKEVVGDVNTRLRGWANYFKIGNSYRQFCEVNAYTTEQLRLFLRRRYQRKRNRGYRVFPNPYLFRRLKLLYIPDIFSARMLLKAC